MSDEWLSRKRCDDEEYSPKGFNSTSLNNPDDQFHRDRA